MSECGVEKHAVGASGKSQEKADAQPKEIFNAPYTFVETYNQLADAVLILSRSPYLVVDCEGYDIARPDGKLSLLTIGTAEARDLFVIDVLNIKDKEEASVVDLLALFTNEAIPKIMWDGRGDFVEIFGWYGVEMQGILDLQIAEVAKQARYETEPTRQARFARQLQYGWKAVRKHKELFSGIHILPGLDGVVRSYKLGENLAKDTEVVAMHRAGESGRWMERPLPERLIQYAANDVYLIAVVYTFFLEKKWIQKGLKAQSYRYINAEKTREDKQRRQQIGASRLLPLGVLSDPSALYGTLHVCSWCKRLLDLGSFQHSSYTQPTPGEKGKKSKKGQKGNVGGNTRSLRRKPCCRVCVVSAMKSEVTIDEEWIIVVT